MVNIGRHNFQKNPISIFNDPRVSSVIKHTSLFLYNILMALSTSTMLFKLSILCCHVKVSNFIN